MKDYKHIAKQAAGRVFLLWLPLIILLLFLLFPFYWTFVTSLKSPSELNSLKDGTFAGGKVENLGLVGTDPAANFVQIAGSTQFGEGFTAEDYAALVAKMFAGEITVSSDIDAAPATTIAVDYQDNIK